jgi:ketosteroid isomerase-like protein
MIDPAEQIRARRAASNAAIAARDAAAVAAFMTEDVTVAVAGGPVLVGREANRRAFAEQMAAAGFLGYVRTPTTLEPGADPRTAIEQGTWEGRWRVGRRVERQRGTYSAEWRLVADVWCIASEVFMAAH